MDRSNNFWKHGSAGFTLPEMLLTMAIMTILFGVGFVAGDQMIRKSRQASLDRMARSIYLAAGRNLETLRLSGNSLSALENSDYLIGTLPNGAVRTNVYRLSNASEETADRAATALLMPDEALGVELTGGAWYISYELGNGICAVHEVFYTTAEYRTDKAFTDLLAGESAEAARRAQRGADRAAERARQGAKVGWFGEGGNIDEKASIPEADEITLPKVGVHVDNGEKLTVTICCALPDTSNLQYYRSNGTPLADPELTLKVVGVSSGAIAYITPNSVSSTQIGAHYEFTATLLLDSLLKNEHFQTFPERLGAEVTGDPFELGEDIRVSASAWYNGIYDAEPSDFGIYVSSATTNSLFASRMDDDYYDDLDVVVVTTSRHLQNLEPAVSGLVCPHDIKAYQTEIIDFDQGWNLNYAQHELKFVYIKNGKLKLYENTVMNDSNISETMYIKNTNHYVTDPQLEILNSNMVGNFKLYDNY